MREAQRFMNSLTLLIFTIFTAAVFGFEEYQLCSKQAGIWFRLLPVIYGIVWCILALLCRIFHWFAAGDLDLSAFFALLGASYGVLCIASASAGYFLWRFKNRVQTK